MLSQIGPLEIVLVLVFALLIFGPKRLPEAGRSLGRGIREFKDSVTQIASDAPGELHPTAERESAAAESTRDRVA